jgi:tRNA(Met) cytidine acetyltransferase
MSRESRVVLKLNEDRIIAQQCVYKNIKPCFTWLYSLKIGANEKFFNWIFSCFTKYFVYYSHSVWCLLNWRHLSDNYPAYFMSQSASIHCYLLALQGDLVTLGERRLVVMHGSESWFRFHIQALLLATEQRFLNYGDKNGWHNVNNQNYRHQLGQEYDLIIFEQDQFSADAFAALAGTLVAGGLLLMRVDELAVGASKPQPFLQRCFRLFASDSHVIHLAEQAESITELAAQTALIAQHAAKMPAQQAGIDICLTAEQKQAVQRIKKVALGHRKRPLVLTADRGRGKSSALAIASAELITTATLNLTILITAPKRDNVKVFFQQLQHELPHGQLHGNIFTCGQHQLVFQPIDQILRRGRTDQASLLLVDEAAGIPVSLLLRLLSDHHRVVFSSTVHGYEGAGRGFTLKFLPALGQSCPDYRQLHLNQAIRWADTDPVEPLIARCCLLNASLAQAVPNLSHQREWHVTQLSTRQLLMHEPLLEQVFALLVTAHYQTSPNDLQLLLDNAHCQLQVLYQQHLVPEQILAVALVLEEGGLPTQHDLVSAVANNQRRLKNQFLPQALSTQLGVSDAFSYRYRRIMRIAVLPSAQQHGLGMFFLQALAQSARQQQVDFMGTSFAVNSQLLKFWQRAQFSLVRLGFTKDHASGEHSALMLMGLNGSAELLQKSLTHEFYRTFCYLLTDEFQQLSTELVVNILRYCPAVSLPELTEYDRQTLVAFSNQSRLYSQSVYALHLFLQHHCQQLTTANADLLPVLARVLQKQSTANVCQQYQFSGKKALAEHLVRYVADALMREH